MSYASIASNVTPNSNASPTFRGKHKYKIDLFIAGKERHVDINASANIPKAVHD